MFLVSYLLNGGSNPIPELLEFLLIDHYLFETLAEFRLCKLKKKQKSLNLDHEAKVSKVQTALYVLWVLFGSH